jgi:hypothetical protein
MLNNIRWLYLFARFDGLLSSLSFTGSGFNVQGYINIGSKVLGSTFKVILEPSKLGTSEPLNPEPLNLEPLSGRAWVYYRPCG